MEMSTEEMQEALLSAQEELDQLRREKNPSPQKIQVCQSTIGHYARELEIMGVNCSAILAT